MTGMTSAEICPEVQATRIYEVEDLKRVSVRVFDSNIPGKNELKVHMKLINSILHFQVIKVTSITCQQIRASAASKRYFNMMKNVQ